MPPKNKSKRKSQGKRKNSQQGQSQASSPSNTPASQATSRPASPPTTATSSTVEQELITPGALDLRLSDPTLPVVDEDSQLDTPMASSVMSDDVTPNTNTDDGEYEEDDDMKTPTAEVPETAIKGAFAAAVAATTGKAAHDTTEAPAEATATSDAGKSAEAPIVPPSPPKRETPENPFGDKSESTVDTAGEPKAQNTSVIEEANFDEVLLGPSDTTSKSAAAPGSSAERHGASHSNEAPIDNAKTSGSTGTSAPANAPLASPSKPHETGNPFLNPGTPLAEESAQEYGARSPLGYENPRPSEAFMQMDAAPDSAPTDKFVSNGGANVAATEEAQNVWAPGQQGFERSEHAPSTSAARDQDSAAAAASSSFVVKDSSASSALEDEEPNFSREGQTGLWNAPTSSIFQQPTGRQLPPTEGALSHNIPPASYPFPAHTTAAAHADNQSPKTLLPYDPHLPLPETLEPHVNQPAPLGLRSADNVRESIEVPDLPGEDLNGFLNPWTRSQQMLAQQQPRIPSPGIEEAAIGTPDLTMISKYESVRTTSANSARSNEPLMPATQPFAGKKFAERHKISSSQLRVARPSIVTPRGLNESLESTSSGRSSRNGRKMPPPPGVLEAELDDVRLDPEPFRSQPRDRFPSLITPAPVFVRARNQGRGHWEQWKSLSRRTKLIVLGIVAVVIALIVGLAAGLVTRRDDDASRSASSSPGKMLKRGMGVANPTTDGNAKHEIV